MADWRRSPSTFARTARTRLKLGSRACTRKRAAKVATAVLRLEAGKTSNVKWIGAIAEYRIDRGPGYRIYLTVDGRELIVLLGGGTKQRQQRDIERAMSLWAEYKLRKAEAAAKRQKE